MIYFLGWSSQGHVVSLGQLIAKGTDVSGWLRPISSHVQTGRWLPPHTWVLLTSRRGDGLSRGHCGPALLSLKTLIHLSPIPAARKRQTDPGGPSAHRSWDRGGCLAGFRAGFLEEAEVAWGSGGESPGRVPWGWGEAAPGTLSVPGPGAVGMRPFLLLRVPPAPQPPDPNLALQSCPWRPPWLASPYPGQSLWASPGACSAHPHRTRTLGGLRPPHHTPVPRAPLEGQGPLLNK